MPCTVVLDRDGTIMYDKHYLHDPEEVELLPGAVEGLSRLAKAGCTLVLLTNQSGIGRGYFTRQDVDAVNTRLLSLLRPHGIRFSGVFICPHTPDEGCDCRKPEPGLMRQAAKVLKFDPKKSYMVGDKECDMGVGKNTGAATILVRTGKGAKHEERCQAIADHVADDLRGVAEIILGPAD